METRLRFPKQESYMDFDSNELIKQDVISTDCPYEKYHCQVVQSMLTNIIAIFGDILEFPHKNIVKFAKIYSHYCLFHENVFILKHSNSN